MNATTIETGSKAAGATERVRLFFVDHLRVALTMLVVVHHVSVIYGANTLFYYVEPPAKDSLAYLRLLVFELINQAILPGLLLPAIRILHTRFFRAQGTRSLL